MRFPLAISALAHVAIVSAVPVADDALPSSGSEKRDVDERYPYTGPDFGIGDWVDQTIAGNGKGFKRVVEPPAVTPANAKVNETVTNNINVISLSYLPDGVNVHFQTPFGLSSAPTVSWGTTAELLGCKSTGQTQTYDRQPPCSMVAVTMCSQFFHDVQIDGLEPDTTYYYQIEASNGTTASDVLSFTTGRAAGEEESFTVAILADLGYTNAAGTYRELLKAIETDEIAFAWHGGDISYADDWYDGLIACDLDEWPVCYNGSDSDIPGGVTPEYEGTLPAGEIPSQGGPHGGEMSVIYESNWDLWQQWLNNITVQIPYMVLPGNHESSCGEPYDGPGNPITAYLNENKINGTANATSLTYYSCPPTQRNFTAYQHRFRMPGAESGGVGNFWYSFDYGLAHFVALDGETDYVNSTLGNFARDVDGNDTLPTREQTSIEDSGPFGFVNGSIYDNKAYEQYQWLAKDLASVNRTKTPWVIVMSHRPMYSYEKTDFSDIIRAAFEDLLLENGVDMYLAGHIHWYERMWPMGLNGTVDSSAIVNNNTYRANPGKSMTHIVNGMAGNVESHEVLLEGETRPNVTAILDSSHYGFSKLQVINATSLKWTFIKGDDGSVGDEVMIIK